MHNVNRTNQTKQIGAEVTVDLYFGGSQNSAWDIAVLTSVFFRFPQTI